ncbi:hypothetical protein F5Y01DRAFT_146178 [Xylaria sp. FL0043]|nr:hypothetical protein F5Y01DRAFT_146178 [Xylaria sp. FL0043]
MFSVRASAIKPSLVGCLSAELPARHCSRNLRRPSIAHWLRSRLVRGIPPNRRLVLRNPARAARQIQILLSLKPPSSWTTIPTAPVALVPQSPPRPPTPRSRVAKILAQRIRTRNRDTMDMITGLLALLQAPLHQEAPMILRCHPRLMRG